MKSKGRTAGKVLMAALAAGTALASADAALAQGSAQPAAQADVVYSFQIPAKPLPQALNDLGRITGLTILYTQDEPLGLTSRPLSGRFTADQALRQLLAGSGYTYSRTDSGAVTLVKLPASSAAVTLAPVTVEGARPGETAFGPVDGYAATQSATGAKTDAPLLEIPQAVSVVGADQIRDQAAQTVAQSLRYTAGVFVEPQGDLSRYDETQIRGFLATQYLDGMRVPNNQFFATPRIEPYGLERVEVLKGPGSVLYGENAPGGLLNMISKRPPEETLREVQATAGSHELFQGAFDVGGPLDEERSLLFRVTGLARDAETAVDFTQDDRLFIAPALTWKPTDRTKITFLANYGEDDGSFPQHFLPGEGTRLDNPNGEISESLFAGEPGFDTFEREQFSLGYAFEHRLDAPVTFRQNLRYAEADVIFNAFRSAGLQADLRTLNRDAFAHQSDAATFTVDNQAQVSFETGALRHEALVGLDYLRQEGDFAYQFAFAGAPTLDVFAPVYGQPIPTLSPFVDNRQTRRQLGLYAQDRIKLDRWILTLGGRQDWAEGKSEDRLAGTSASRDDEEFTVRAGLTYVFDVGLALYGSYATSFQPTEGTDLSGAPFEPTTGEQFELGAKFEPARFPGFFTASVFHLTQENALTPDAANPLFNTQTGEVEVRGLELEARARPLPGLDLIATYALLDSEVTKSNTPAELGREIPLTPRHQASAWANYAFQGGPLAGFSLGGGVRYVGEVFGEVSSAEPIPSDAYTLFDAALRYRLGALDDRLDGATVALNVTNLTDERHVTYCFGTTLCNYGAGRTALFNVTYRW